jgi:hypothetical protein
MTDTETGEILLSLPRWQPAIAAAFVAAWGELNDVTRDKTAKVEMKGGGSYAYSYADLGSVLEVVRPVLAKHDLAVLNDVISRNRSIDVYTMLIHSSGETMTFGPITFDAGGTPQATGSSITYARRYSLLGALGIATEDDDGAEASADATRRAARPAAESTGRRKAAARPAEALHPDDPVLALESRIKALTEAQKATLKSFTSGRSVSAKALASDAVWLREVAATVTMLETGSTAELEALEAHEGEAPVATAEEVAELGLADPEPAADEGPY